MKFSNHNLSEIGSRIRDARNEHKWLISQLSEHSGLSVAHISSIERGKCNFSIESLINISDALKVDIDYLLFGKVEWNNDLPDEFMEIVNDCNSDEAKIVIENAKSLIGILRGSKK